MTRAPDQFAPAWLPRQQRRHVDRALRKLFRRNACSVCGSPFRHNTRTAGGLDVQGRVVLAGACCLSQVAATFVQGIYSDRQYDFPWPHGDETGAKPTDAQIAEAIGLYQNAISETDKAVDDLMRRGGGMPIAPRLNLLDSAWKQNDGVWFEQNPGRSHRVRLPFPGEAGQEARNAPAGMVLMVLLRQVKPGFRMRAAVHLPTDWLPVPDHEAAGYALWEMAAQREPPPSDREGLDALIAKYTVHRERGQ